MCDDITDEESHRWLRTCSIQIAFLIFPNLELNVRYRIEDKQKPGQSDCCLARPNLAQYKIIDSVQNILAKFQISDVIFDVAADNYEFYVRVRDAGVHEGSFHIFGNTLGIGSGLKTGSSPNLKFDASAHVMHAWHRLIQNVYFTECCLSWP